MEKTYRIFCINPGSTSTKIAMFENDITVFSKSVSHDANVLKEFKEIGEQFPYRKQMILDILNEAGIALTGVDAFVGRGGGLVGLVGGTYPVNDILLEHARIGFTIKHPATLGSQLARDFAETYGGKAYVVDPPDVDEFDIKARITGFSDIFRESRGHPLNQKEVARRHAVSLGKKYEDMNLVVSHLGGGVSVSAHRQGRIIDSSDVTQGDGPMAPTRSGSIPAAPLIKMCFSGKFTERQMLDRVIKSGGYVEHLGTSDAREVSQRAASGDERAALIFDALVYQVIKFIGAYSAVLSGDVDGILLTGGMAHDKNLTDKITQAVSYIAPVSVYAGEFEMEALAAGALRVLRGEEEPREYTGIPIFQGL